MDEKNPWYVDFAINNLPYLTTLILSFWGGTVNYITRLRNKKLSFNFKELALDLVVSGFAGFLTFLLCRHASISESMSAVLIAISGHMGTRAILGFEFLYSRIIKG